MRVLKVTHLESGIAVVTVEELPEPDDGVRLHKMQSLVGGLIEHVPTDIGLDLWCNEEGLLLGLPLHRTPFTVQPIAGDYFLAATDEEGYTVGLTDAEIHQAQSWLIDGGPLSPAGALSRIAELMDGKEWNADTLEEIATIIRATGRAVEEFNPESEE
jgi:hypothetical protein